jgi:hypothetical protein
MRRIEKRIQILDSNLNIRCIKLDIETGDGSPSYGIELASYIASPYRTYEAQACIC